MMHLVTGGSGSGKSAYAEQQVLEAGDAPRYYIATMMPYGVRAAAEWRSTAGCAGKSTLRRSNAIWI